jgi:hypothetical protein
LGFDARVWSEVPSVKNPLGVQVELWTSKHKSQQGKTDQEICLDAVKAYMLENGGDKTKLKAGSVNWAEVKADATKTADSVAKKAKDATGGRRLLKRTNPGTGTALKNMHCCHLQGDPAKKDERKIFLYTAVQLKGVTPAYGPGALDYGQTMWAGAQKAKFMSAMLLPDYDYITDTDRSQLFDKKLWKASLGEKKTYDGWNFGYQCFNSLAMVTVPYSTQEYPIYSQARIASTL